MEPTGLRSLKIVLLVSSLVSLVFLVLAAFQENFRADWRGYQRQYAAALASASGSAPEGGDATDYQIEVRQIFLESLGRVDRCVSCHVGIDNPGFVDAEQPLTAHPGELLKHHPSDKFGCTICHQGQGRATSHDDAHGRVEHWPQPMLEGDMVYTSCGRCHYETDLYGGQADLYGQASPLSSIPRGALLAGLPGADNLARGKKLVADNGCLGCHKYRGRGGTLGPDITHVGDKTIHDFDFTHVPGERSVRNWLTTHFRSPSAVVPNTVMPEYELTDAQTEDLTAYMVSLKRKSAPAAYTPLPMDSDPTPVRGETLFAMYCSSCHGADGLGATVRDPEVANRIDVPRELLTPSLRNGDTLGVASDAFLRHIVARGRPGTSMPAWGEQGLSDDEIDLLVSFIRRWSVDRTDVASVSASRGNAGYGRALFRANCSGCHGLEGGGGQVGISLNSPTFLAIASDQFLAATITAGRANTAMPSWRGFDNREISDLLAFIRSWSLRRSVRADVLRFLAERGDQESTDETSKTPADPPAANVLRPAGQREYRPSVRLGKTLYRSRCTVCHGQNGEGKIGPSLNNESVLTVVSDEYLHDTIVRGHPGTAMPAWWQLSSEDVADVIVFLRSWQNEPDRQLARRHVTGDWQNGENLYRGMCSSCHGPEAEGAIGPQLRNPVYLDTIPDSVLLEWIRHGRIGTQMRPFVRGGQGAAELSDSQIVDIVTYLRSLRGRAPAGGQRIGIGFAPRGRVLFGDMCAGCHGQTGEGGSGPAIRNPSFLAAASDGFMRATVALGREGTEMRAMAHRGSGIVELQADQIDDLIAFLRSNVDRRPIPHRFVAATNLRRGAELFTGLCSGCHGPDGKGQFAPELHNDEFLRAATDGYLQATIIRGRRGTAMRPFGLGGAGLAKLKQDEINDLVGFIRQWSPDTRPLRRQEAFPVTDDPDALSADSPASTEGGRAAEPSTAKTSKPAN